MSNFNKHFANEWCWPTPIVYYIFLCATYSSLEDFPRPLTRFRDSLVIIQMYWFECTFESGAYGHFRLYYFKKTWFIWSVLHLNLQTQKQDNEIGELKEQCSALELRVKETGQSNRSKNDMVSVAWSPHVCIVEFSIDRSNAPTMENGRKEDQQKWYGKAY